MLPARRSDNRPGGRIGWQWLAGEWIAMRLLAYNRTPKRKLRSRSDVCIVASNFWRRAIFISIRRADAGTRGMIGEAGISKDETGRVLINTARGALVDETALVKALVEKADRGSCNRCLFPPNRYRLIVRCERRHICCFRPYY